jgi:hypothetical protein
MAYSTDAEYQARLLLDDSAAAMPTLSQRALLLNRAKLAIDAFCRRDFDEHKADEIEMEGNGTDRYLLPCHPVNAVNSITIDGEDLTEAQLSEIVRTTWGRVILPFSVAEDVPIVFDIDHGYAAADIPAPVKEASLMLASRMWRHFSARERVAEGVTEETLGDYTIKFVQQGMDKDVAALLTGGKCVRSR